MQPPSPLAADRTVSGFAAPGYGPVFDAFRDNVEREFDLGASVAVYRYGEKVVDAWGGSAVDGAPITADAAYAVFSVTKTLVALCVARLVEQGRLRFDDRVADHWPEFGANGKAEITVDQLVSHRAGLPGFDLPVSLDDLRDLPLITGMLAAQSPRWTPGSAHGYHGMTVGFLVGEVVRRITGVTVGVWFAQEFGRPLGLNTWIGTPAEADHLVTPSSPEFFEPELPGALPRAALDPQSDAFYVLSNPQLDSTMYNRLPLRRAEIPAANGISDARSLAKLLSTLVDGELRGFSPSTVDLVRAERSNGPDRVNGGRSRYGSLFALRSDALPMVPPTALGHEGYGGSLAFADPESGITLAYLGNRPYLGPGAAARSGRVVDALTVALRRLG